MMLFGPATLRECAEELLAVQLGSVEEAMLMVEDGHGIFSEEEEAAIVEYLEELGNTQPLREI